MKLSVDFSELHSVIECMGYKNSIGKSYHLVHSMEQDVSSFAITSSKWSSPLIPALYCLFLAEGKDQFHLSAQDIICLLVDFYGFKRVPITEETIEIDLSLARDEYCAEADNILGQPLLDKAGLLSAIRGFAPIGFKSFERKILDGAN